MAPRRFTLTAARRAITQRHKERTTLVRQRYGPPPKAADFTLGGVEWGCQMESKCTVTDMVAHCLV